MRYIHLSVLALSLLLIGCAEKAATKDLSTPSTIDTVLGVPDTIVHDSLLHYDKETSLWTLGDQLYSGYTVSFYQDNILKGKTGFLNGRKQNKARQWFPDGHLKRASTYFKGRLHGEKKTWSSDSAHFLISKLNYQFGKPQGEQKIWYATGELYKVLNLNKGKEEGIQQAYRKNGELYANYEAKAGRIFGMKKAALCYGLEDENINYEN